MRAAELSSNSKSEFGTCGIMLYSGSNGGPAGPVLGRSSMASLHPTVKHLHLVHSCYIFNSASQECVCLGLKKDFVKKAVCWAVLNQYTNKWAIQDLGTYHIRGIFISLQLSINKHVLRCNMIGHKHESSRAEFSICWDQWEESCTSKKSTHTPHCLRSTWRMCVYPVMDRLALLGVFVLVAWWLFG